MAGARTPQAGEICRAGLVIRKRSEGDKIVALAGNPNVGKSTIFNALTGMNQHTGNWPGKTVANAQGYCARGDRGCVMVDIPGCYSLMAHSAEEEVARDFICFGKPDAVVVVCDATCLERNLNLVLQTIEAAPRVVVCVNLLDEARKKKINVNLPLLSRRLGTPVVGAAARGGEGLEQLLVALDKSLQTEAAAPKEPLVRYPAYIEDAIARLTPAVSQVLSGGETGIDVRWLCARLLDADESLLTSIRTYAGVDLEREPVASALRAVREEFARTGATEEQIRDDLATVFVKTAEQLCRDVVTCEKERADRRDRRLDKWFTSRLTGFPIMLLILLGVFWLTISGANMPSALLAKALFGFEDWAAAGLAAAGAPGMLIDLLLHGVYRVMAWVVSVMLPPMAIFFPLFTLLEDFGYLPRVAFNLDRCFKGCAACGKQALTMCMGFGCNAAGVTGCRIIDSPRERLIAIITNNFVPCNGRFPTIISVISMFLLGGAAGIMESLGGAAILVGVIVFGVGMTLLISKTLSKTILKGVPSSFTLELPPYRRPQIGKVIVRSVVDRTLKVLGRAVISAAPAGLVIWILANVQAGDASLLAHLTGFLDPFARTIGMDGVILTGFILGLPANEIVVPIIIMAYTAQGSLLELEGAALLNLFVQNGWTWLTAINVILFSLMHWPCATTCLTIHKETQSFKWTAVSFLVPTVCGVVVCFLFTTIARFFL